MGVNGKTNDYGKEDSWIYAPTSREYGVLGLLKFLKEMVTQIVYSKQQIPIIQRINWAFKENWPLAKQSAKNSMENVLRWMHRGGPWRPFLVITVGMISLIALTGLGAFVLFLLAATTNTLVVSLLMSLAAVGGFMALFFTCLTAIYVVTLSIAAFVVSVATLLTISAVLVAAGWIGFFWLVWKGIRKSVDIARGSVVMTASTLAAISANRSTQKVNPEKSF